MHKSLAKSPNASTKKLEDLVSPQQTHVPHINKAGSLASPRLGSGHSGSSGISSLKNTASFFASKATPSSHSTTYHHRNHSNDLRSKSPHEDIKVSPRGTNLSHVNKKGNKAMSSHSKLHSISEMSHEHKESIADTSRIAPKQSEIDLTKHVHIRFKDDKESEKEALHLKGSPDVRVPTRKISVTSAEHKKEHHSYSKLMTEKSDFDHKDRKDTILSPKHDTNNELDTMQRENSSSVMDTPNAKLKKSVTNSLNTVSINLAPSSAADKLRHSLSGKRGQNHKDQSMERRRSSVENTSRNPSPPKTIPFEYFSRQTVTNSEETGNIKVVARFRPLNKAENDLIANGLGSQCVSFPNSNTAIIAPENSMWTFDSVFPPTCRQQDVYDFLGRETIEDVLTGYNGTIFAYGQTSSGKTFTMFGDIHDPNMQGIVPRVSDHIFSHIENIEDEVEFVINCSMLEIYKENLYDLLNDRTGDLKIKENPRKGIFVEGLSEISICSSEEMMEVLEIGERSRTTAATRMNQYSSRSHTLFIMDISQRYPNRAEKRGKLNLIDLAGSEKVGKSGAAGETLEEAKKINLSLSCLGNVIHALTTNSDHIPYRDSKLTRILQESLGGNYKTSLIVTCSPHSSNKEESISTLKFATRAKTIKTHYKMNIQTSPDTMAYVMDKLKQELDDAKNELAKFKSGGFMYPLEYTAPHSDVKAINFTPPEFAWKDKKSKISEEGSATERPHQISLDHDSALKVTKSLEKHDFPHQNIIYGLTDSHTKHQQGHTLRGSSSIGQLNRSSLERSSHDIKIQHDSYIGDVVAHKGYESYNYFKSNLELINENQILEARSANIKESMETLKFVVAEKEQTIKAHEEKILMQKNELLQLEKTVNTLREQTDIATLKLNQQTDNSGYLNSRVHVLEKQVESLSEALLSCEQSIQALLQDKLKLANQKFEDMIKQDVELKQVSLPAYFKNLFRQNDELHSKHQGTHDFRSPSKAAHSKASSQTPLANQLEFQTNSLFKTLAASITVPVSHASLIEKSVYGTSVKGSTLEDSNISPQLTIYLLQQQLIQSSIINKHLERVISGLEWKQMIEYGRARIQSDYSQMQEQYIQNVETVLAKAGLSHERLKNRVEAMEIDAIKLRETFIQQGGETRRVMPVTTPRAKLVRPINKEKSHKLLIKKLDATPGSKSGLTLKFNAAASREASPEANKDRFSGGYSTRRNNRFSSHDNFSSLMKEVEKDLTLSHTTPLTIDEAKLIINSHEQVILKLKKCLANNLNYHETGGDHAFFEIDYLRSENERLENKLLILQTEHDLEKTKSEQLREAYLEVKKQSENYKRFNEEIEISSKKALKIENESWQKIIEELRLVSENEILRKQEEINKMHDILAKWIFKFMELQEQRGHPPSHQEHILYETYKRQELPSSGLLYTALGSGTKTGPESGGLSARFTRQSDQGHKK